MGRTRSIAAYRSLTCRVAIAVIGACLSGLARPGEVAEEAHQIFPPLQLFKDLCVDAGWSLAHVTELADQRHLALISSESVPTPHESPALKNIWEARTVVGPIGIVVIEGGNSSGAHTFTCSVTAPSDSANFIQLWLQSSLGDPAFKLNKPENAAEIHWTNAFDGGKAEVILLTRVPGENSALLSVMKHQNGANERR
jgi:hypothetical protein